MNALHSSRDLDALMDAIGERSIVMLGEASHGTHEFYTWRAAITRRLVEEKGFGFIAVEGDWPDCYRINRFVKAYKDAGNDIVPILKDFDRWPTWMWANWETAALAEWLRKWNEVRPAENRVGFYGLDVYSLWESMDVMMNYLLKEDPQTAEAVRKAIRCFEPYGGDEQAYAYTALGKSNCRDAVVSLLKEIRMKAAYLDGDREAGFNTEQNALIAVNAEQYYRSMLGFGNESWNVRDMHMMQTLGRLMKFHGSQAKGIVWEHNTHIGDARATDMELSGMVNIGQLAREQYGDDAVWLTGFCAYEGKVIAGESWGATMEEMEVPRAMEGSVEASLHAESTEDRYMIFEREEMNALYDGAVPHRAIGVVYDPAREKPGNYVPSVLSRRYDALIYLDNTRAVHPLHMKPHHEKVPETYPFGV